MSASLNEARRASDLEALAGGETVDVVVVGGGVTGAGIALDAASRGLSVALLERRDLAHGTSRWSSKLVHGGLRYLEQGDVGLAWESAVERATLVRTRRTAPRPPHPPPDPARRRGRPPHGGEDDRRAADRGHAAHGRPHEPARAAAARGA